jgi:hypothetical protein
MWFVVEKNDSLKCSCFMRKLCVKSMIMKINVWCFEHEAWAWMWVKCIRHYKNRDKSPAYHTNGQVHEGKPSMLWIEC